jgi:hypothetical protein
VRRSNCAPPYARSSPASSKTPATSATGQVSWGSSTMSGRPSRSPPMPHTVGRQRHTPGLTGGAACQQPRVGADLRRDLAAGPAGYRPSAHRHFGVQVAESLSATEIRVAASDASGRWRIYRSLRSRQGAKSPRPQRLSLRGSATQHTVIARPPTGRTARRHHRNGPCGTPRSPRSSSANASPMPT